MDAETAATATCDRCGREAAGHLGDEALCESCYHEASSCCGLFGEES
jgi:NMD protein affecting ribosome stability and mRNA decay